MEFPDGVPPLIETGPIFDANTDGVYRMDRIGARCSLLYFEYRIDPQINGGRVFRTPTARLNWILPNLKIGRGAVSTWVSSGPPEGSLLVAPFVAIPKRELM